MGISRGLGDFEPGATVTCPECLMEIPVGDTDMGAMDEGEILCPNCQGKLSVTEEPSPEA